jgi:hypothetical protein
VNAYFCPDPSVCSYCGNCASSSPGNAYICCTSQNSPTPYTCCTGYNPTNYYTCCTGYNASNPYSCCNSYNASNPYSCNCTVNHSIKLIKSIASAISTVYTFTLGATAVGIKTILSGNTVTVAGYSATGLSTQIGSNQNTTISGQTKTNFHGIIKAPVTYSTVQTSDIDEFRVN